MRHRTLGEALMYPCCMLHCYCNNIASPTSAKLSRWTIRKCSQKSNLYAMVYGKVNSERAYSAQCIYAEEIGAKPVLFGRHLHRAG